MDICGNIGLSSLLRGIREGFGIDLWIHLAKDGIQIKERSPIDGRVRVLTTKQSLDGIKGYLIDLLSVEGVLHEV